MNVMKKKLAVGCAAAMIAALSVLTAPAPAQTGPTNACLGKEPNVVLTSERDASIYRLYCAFFLRKPDQEGFRFWHDSPYDLPWMAQFFSQSEEFQIRYGTHTDQSYTDLIYRNVFDRAPDAGGLAYWVNRLATDLDRGRVMLFFSDSPEYRSYINTPIKETRGTGTLDDPYSLGSTATGITSGRSTANAFWDVTVESVEEIPAGDAGYGWAGRPLHCWLIVVTHTLTEVNGGAISRTIEKPSAIIGDDLLRIVPTTDHCGTTTNQDTGEVTYLYEPPFDKGYTTSTIAGGTVRTYFTTRSRASSILYIVYDGTYWAP